jgi:DNA-binding NtrC family response regulator
MVMGNILIVDDDTKIRGLLSRIISFENYKVFEAADLKTAGKVVQKEAVDVIVCDVMLPDGNGIDFTKNMKAKLPWLEIILLTGHGSIADGVQAMKYGAMDYILKGNDNEKLIPLIEHAIEKVRLHKKVQQLEKQLADGFGFDCIVGKSTIIQNTITQAKKVAAVNTTVLLLGETGTGKELFARAIHAEGPRSGQPFLALNCSAFSKNLLESELFGHKAGAFTGALKDKKGLLEEANGGTLFLDEIGEMNINLQAKLLRVLETNEFIKVGSTTATTVDVRIISATNRDLRHEVTEGNFREDLYYRLNVFTLQIPPLRERKKDIPLLATYFIDLFAKKMNKHISGVDKEFLTCLDGQYWKGNIREMKNAIERAVIMAEQPVLAVTDLPLEIQFPQEEDKYISSFDFSKFEKLHIQRVLAFTKGDKSEAARLMNISLSTIYRKIEAYGLA